MASGFSRKEPAFSRKEPVSGGGSLPKLPVGTDDAELLHPEAERVRVEAEPLGGVAAAVDPPAALGQHRLDVGPLDRIERVADGAGALGPAGA